MIKITVCDGPKFITESPSMLVDGSVIRSKFGEATGILSFRCDPIDYDLILFDMRAALIRPRWRGQSIKDRERIKVIRWFIIESVVNERF